MIRVRAGVIGMVGVISAPWLVGCSGGSDDATPAPSAPSASASADPSSSSSTSSSTIATTTTEPPIEDGPLVEVCPETIVVQTSMLPGPDAGPLYALLGPEPQVDVAAASTAAPLVRVDGTEEDVTLEIRSGGPAVGFRPALDVLGGDSEILLAQTSTATALSLASSIPSVGVVSLTDRSRDVIIVDPATYPDVDSLDALSAAGVEVQHVTNDPFAAYLAGTGALDAAQLVPGFDGEPAAFVQSGGTIAQQGDELVEPVLIPSLPQWARPVVALDATSSGWVDYSDALVVRPEAIDEHEECLGRLVPVIQEATSAYAADPHDTNGLMTVARAQLTPLPRLNVELMDAGVANGVETGVFGDGADTTVGNFDTERLEPFLGELAGILAVDSVAVDDLVTNEFIDPDITSAG